MGKTANTVTLTIFAPVLILAGVGGFLIPAEKSLFSGAPAYNVFHIVFGCVGLAAVLSRRESAVSLFNVGFGVIDLYQALASHFHLPPEQYFRWTAVDDISHILIGAALVVIGGVAMKNTRRTPKERNEPGSR